MSTTSLGLAYTTDHSWYFDALTGAYQGSVVGLWGLSNITTIWTCGHQHADRQAAHNCAKLHLQSHHYEHVTGTFTQWVLQEG